MSYTRPALLESCVMPSIVTCLSSASLPSSYMAIIANFHNALKPEQGTQRITRM